MENGEIMTDEKKKCEFKDADGICHQLLNCYGCKHSDNKPTENCKETDKCPFLCKNIKKCPIGVIRL